MRRALLAAMIATAVAGIPVRPAHADGETVALAVEGRVTVVRAGVGDIALAPGIVIESGDHLVSDDAGRALIRSSDNALVSIGPYTQAMFDDGEGDGRNPIVTILSGDARILLRETDSQSGTVIATKSAAIRARDAYFLVRHERGDERTRVLALSGSIDVARAGDERVNYTVVANQWCAVDRATGVSIPQAAGEELTAAMKEPTAIRYAPDAESLPGQSRNLGDNPLRDIPTKLAGPAVAADAHAASAVEFDPFPADDGRSADVPGGLEIDRESEVSLVIIFNDLVAKNRPLVKK